MAITTQYGNEVVIDTALFDGEGEYVAVMAIRSADKQRRVYRLNELRAPGGMAEIYAGAKSAPVKESVDARW